MQPSLLPSLILVVASSLFLLRSSGADAQPRSRFLLVTQVGEPFRKTAELAAGTIPEHVWQSLSRAQWRVAMAEFVLDAAPALRGAHPRGWPADSTWDSTDALHLPASRLLVLAEKRRTTNGEVVLSNRIAGTLRHEIGHAFDLIQTGAGSGGSAESTFRSAYHRDVAAIPAELRSKLSYYLQSGRAGPQEVFAEAFAMVLGGGSDVAQQNEFKQAFPSVLDYFNRRLPEHAGPLAEKE